MTGEVWIDKPQRGSWNMAMDQAMLEYATATQQVVLRIYQWSRPTVSLGYFQSYEDLVNYPAVASLDCVRRMTGGGAILHDQEITYSIGVPGNIQRKGHHEALYRAVHRAVVAWLQGLGIPANLWEDANRESAQPYTGEGSFWCFERRSDIDIVLGGRKILGSAQRRNAFGLLQHGSLLIEPSLWTPELLGIYSDAFDPRRQTTNEHLTANMLAETIRRALERSLKCLWHEGTPDENIVERAKAIDFERFSTPEWTRDKNRHGS